MRAHEFTNIFEDYNTAKQKYLQQVGQDKEKEIVDALKLHKQLKPKIKSLNMEIDIDKISTFQQLQDVVKKAQETNTKTDVKKGKNKGDFHVLHEDNEWLVVIPLNKDASCAHGRQTDWCTTKVDQHHFEQYFYRNEITLIYFINKNKKMQRQPNEPKLGQVNEKYAMAVHKDTNKMELFDLNDNRISDEVFHKKTGFDPNQIREQVVGTEISKITDRARKPVSDVSVKVQEMIYDMEDGKRNPEIEKMLLITRNPTDISEYTETAGKHDYPEPFQIAMVNSYATLLDYINNPTLKTKIQVVKNIYDEDELLKLILTDDEDDIPEELQMAIVNLNGNYIEHLLEKGIVPTEKVQIAAIKNTDDTEYDGFVADSLIYADIELSEKVILAILNQNGEYAEELMNNGYELTEKMLLTAVSQNSRAIKYIDDPSEAVQIAAVRKSHNAIRYIENPTERVEELFRELYDRSM